jgi:NADP-dependent alcohol dehydrogenase
VNNFVFHNPVRVLFGKGQIAAIAKEIPENARILLTAGGGSIKDNGVHAQVRRALEGRDVRELWGIEPNPQYATLMKGVELARRDRVDYLLAVGGGSVCDGTKFIAAAVGFEGDPWDLLAKRARLTSALPMGAVLTLPATGSEMNSFAVVSREGDKRAFGNALLYPRFSVLDPETTFSLPPRQVGNGIVDAFTHTMEQYLTYPAEAPLQDRFAESILRTLIEVGPVTYAEPRNYDARATLMWTATMALNGIIGVGVPQDWATHNVGHELTALYGIDHARTLALVLPSMLRVRREAKRAKLLQYAERVWGLPAAADPATSEARIDESIEKTCAFFESVGVPTRLAAYGLGAEVVPAVIGNLSGRGEIALGERRDVGRDTVEQVLNASL